MGRELPVGTRRMHGGVMKEKRADGTWGSIDKDAKPTAWRNAQAQERAAARNTPEQKAKREAERQKILNGPGKEELKHYAKKEARRYRGDRLTNKMKQHHLDARFKIETQAPKFAKEANKQAGIVNTGTDKKTLTVSSQEQKHRRDSEYKRNAAESGMARHRAEANIARTVATKRRIHNRINKESKGK